MCNSAAAVDVKAPEAAAAERKVVPSRAERQFLLDLGLTGRQGPTPEALKGLARDCHERGFLIFRQVGEDSWYFLSDSAIELLGLTRER